MKILIVLLFMSGLAQAQFPTTLPSDEAVAAQIDAVQKSVYLVAPTLWSAPVSEALRRAAQNRGVSVYLLVTPRLAEAPDAYTSWHALQGTAQVKTLDTEGSYLILDGVTLVDGPFVAAPTKPFDARDTYVVRDPALAAERARVFATLWAEAAPLNSFVERVYFERTP